MNRDKLLRHEHTEWQKLLTWIEQRSWLPYAAAAVFALIFTLALDATTNSLDTDRYVWDWVHYIDMAEHGITDNPGLVAPYAYRALPPLLAGAFAEFSGRSVVLGFRLLAYTGVVGQLVMAFALARLFIQKPSRRFWGAFAVMLVIAFSTFNTKFYLFDIFRTDPLAFPLLLLGMYALCRRIMLTSTAAEPPAAPSTVLIWDIVCISASVIGMQAREFCLLPAALLCLSLAHQLWRERRLALLIELIILALVAAAAFFAPRVLLNIARSDQLTDVTSLDHILSLAQRNINIALGLFLYGLPLWMLITPRRVQIVWARLNGYRIMLALYVLAVIALSFIGGTDIARFTAYLAPPLIICLALLIDQPISRVEIGYMLAAWAVFNRLLWAVPMESIDAYLDFYVVYWDRTSAVTQARIGEAVFWVAGSLIVRGLLNAYTHRSKPGMEHPPAAHGIELDET